MYSNVHRHDPVHSCDVGASLFVHALPPPKALTSFYGGSNRMITFAIRKHELTLGGSCIAHMFATVLQRSAQICMYKALS